MADAALDEKIKGENVQVFDSEEELAVALAKYTADLSKKFCQERAAFTVGGSLIKSLRKLVDPPYVDSVDWGKWHVFWVDERVVPKDHPDNGAADDYETCLKQLVKSGTITQSEVSEFPKFDLMLLGMGPDGHVASVFPGHPLLKEDKQWVTFIKDSPKPPPERITFTFPVINSSANIALVVAEAGKASAVHTTLGNGQGPGILPVQMVSPEGQLTLFLDKTAASKLLGPSEQIELIYSIHISASMDVENR